MLRVECHVRIDRPIETVFAAVIDIKSWPEWTAPLQKVEAISGVIAVGTTFKRFDKYVHKVVESPAQVIVYDPPYHFVTRSQESLVPSTLSFHLESQGGSVQLTHIAELDPRGFFAMAAPLAARIIKGKIQHDLNVFKQRLESV